MPQNERRRIGALSADATSSVFPSPAIAPTATPPAKAVTKAATGRSNANGSPNSEPVARMESAPVCGVDIKNDTVAARDAPSRRIDMAAGITPHEHSGNGTPKRAA